jgi:hypothetical protein
MSLLDIAIAALILGSEVQLTYARAIVEELGLALHEQWLYEGLSAELSPRLSSPRPLPSTTRVIRVFSWWRKQIPRVASACIAAALLILIFK